MESTSAVAMSVAGRGVSTGNHQPVGALDQVRLRVAVLLIEDRPGAKQPAREAQRLAVGSEDEVLGGRRRGMTVRQVSSCSING